MRLKASASVLRALVVAVMLAGWLVASNHCALGALLAKGTEVSGAQVSGHEHCCPEHSDSGKKKDSDSPNACCKSLQAVSALSKSDARHDETLFAVQSFPASAAAVSGRFVASSPLALDTGPPKSASFAESVLQRSILAHAPPFAA